MSTPARGMNDSGKSVGWRADEQIFSGSDPEEFDLIKVSLMTETTSHLYNQRVV